MQRVGCAQGAGENHILTTVGFKTKMGKHTVRVTVTDADMRTGDAVLRFRCAGPRCQCAVLNPRPLHDRRGNCEQRIPMPRSRDAGTVPVHANGPNRVGSSARNRTRKASTDEMTGSVRTESAQ